MGQSYKVGGTTPIFSDNGPLAYKLLLTPLNKTVITVSNRLMAYSLYNHIRIVHSYRRKSQNIGKIMFCADNTDL